MKYMQAQFSFKYEPQIKIRRSVNQIEDLLQDYYGAPQVMPIPDDFAAEAPRIVLRSHGGHSQISFSQISMDFTVNFDGEYADSFETTKEYIKQRIDVLKGVLRNIGIEKYYFFGLTYNVELEGGYSNSLEHIKKLLGGNVAEQHNLYEASQRIALVEDEKFFVNQQIGTFRQYQSNGISIPNLLEFTNSKLVSEGVSVTVDVNNRYAFLNSGNSFGLDCFDSDFDRIFSFVEETLQKWK